MKTRAVINFYVSILFTILLLANPIFTAQAAPVHDALGISVSPPSGEAGSTVSISGAGFDPGGYNGTIQWDGATQYDFLIPGGGAFSVDFTIPSGASSGEHVISVCAACGDGDVEQKASTSFTVTAPILPVIPVIPLPSVAPVVPLAPVVTLPPGVPVVPSIPGVCTSFDLGADAEVFLALNYLEPVLVWLISTTIIYEY